MNNNKKIIIPFDGFYESYSNDILDTGINNDIDFLPMTEDELLKFSNLYYGCDWGKIHKEYAKLYCESFNKWLNDETSLNHNVTLEFESLHSPKYYNYETDKIYAYISLEDINFLFKHTKPETLSLICKERFTSYDGFISHYDNDYTNWGDVKDWDHNQLETLLLSFISDNLNYYNDKNVVDVVNYISIYSIMDDSISNGSIHNLLYNNYTTEFKDYLNTIHTKYGEQ